MVMVQTVMFPPVTQKIFRRVQLMDCIMYKQVRRIANREARKENQAVISKNKIEEKEK